MLRALAECTRDLRPGRDRVWRRRRSLGRRVDSGRPAQRPNPGGRSTSGQHRSSQHRSRCITRRMTCTLCGSMTAARTTSRSTTSSRTHTSGLSAAAASPGSPTEISEQREDLQRRLRWPVQRVRVCRRWDAPVRPSPARSQSVLHHRVARADGPHGRYAHPALPGAGAAARRHVS